MTTILKPLIPFRQASHVEPNSNDFHKPKERQLSTGYLERKTRNGSVISVENEDEPPLSEADIRKDGLITTLKKEVKQIMENAPSRRRISIHSTYVTSLCAAVENCLLDGLKRRLLGLFGARSTFALLHSIAKHCAAAATALNVTTEHANRER
uniref:RUN domain-containing protein n=1 Tax=Acrobeloides nanus TaxID=290746 RepID=A0A914CJT7_9BILA